MEILNAHNPSEWNKTQAVPTTTTTPGKSTDTVLALVLYTHSVRRVLLRSDKAP